MNRELDVAGVQVDCPCTDHDEALAPREFKWAAELANYVLEQAGLDLGWTVQFMMLN